MTIFIDAGHGDVLRSTACYTNWNIAAEFSMALPNQCFVLMPTGGKGEYPGGEREAEFIFNDIICPAVRDRLGKDFPVVRQVDEVSPGAITHDIIRNIAKSGLVIVDITGLNANVFFELGVRFTLSPSSTLLLAQKGTIIPFDIGSYSCIIYEPKYDGVRNVIRKITLAIERMFDDPVPRQDSLVYDALRFLTVSFSGQQLVQEMPWSEFRERLNAIAIEIRLAMEKGTYRPNVVVAITNGGGIFGELLMRQLNLSTDTPLVFLWADRRRARHFDDKINDATLSGVRAYLEGEAAQGNRNQNILLLDDRIRTNRTAAEAMEKLRSALPAESTIRYLPMMTREAGYLSLCRHYILWTHEAFGFNDKKIEALHAVARDYFPYSKAIL